MSRLQKMLVGVSALLLVVLIGCSGFQDAIAPMNINPEIGEYTEEEMTSWVPWTTIYDGDRLFAKMVFLHTSSMIELERAAEDETRHVTFLTDGFWLDRASAIEFRDNVFSASGPGGLLISTLLGGTLGATLISKPSDKKEIEKLKNGEINAKNNS